MSDASKGGSSPESTSSAASGSSSGPDPNPNPDHPITEWPDRQAHSPEWWSKYHVAPKLGDENRAHIFARPYAMPAEEVSDIVARYRALTAPRGGSDVPVGLQPHLRHRRDTAGKPRSRMVSDGGFIEGLYKYCQGKERVSLALGNELAAIINRIRRNRAEQVALKDKEIAALRNDKQKEKEKEESKKNEDGNDIDGSFLELEPDELRSEYARAECPPLRDERGDGGVDVTVLSEMLRQMNLLKLDLAAEMAARETVVRRLLGFETPPPTAEEEAAIDFGKLSI